MSRTYKDKPRWVLLNDLRQTVAIEHRHHTLGISLIDYWGKPKQYSETCTGFRQYNWQDDYDWYYIPCKRVVYGWWLTFGGKFPHDCRVKPYRARRREFTKRQVRIYNSNPEMHDDMDFMNEEEFELTYREATHKRSF